MNAVDKKAKSRNQSIFEFFEVLQVEWLCADLRSRIYPRLKDKEYWRRVKVGKQQTIENIAEKNKLPTIFSDSDMKEALERRLYREKGCPIFVYRDEDQRKAQERLDLLYYYNKGTEVRVEYFGEVRVAKIDDYTPYSSTVSVKLVDQDLYLDFNINEVTRIL